MKTIKLITATFILLCSAATYAGGLLMPTNSNYPKDFLRLNVTSVTVNIHGSVAETVVYQEFKNEWYDSTDAVYSFPLPPNARATEVLYWYNDVVYKAVLQVKEQATNPGTGEGGLAAQVNNYIGRNGIKIYLKNIKAGMIQRIELHYVSLCDYYAGNYTYTFPLNTEEFIKYPIDHLEFNINVFSNSEIKSFGIPTHTGYDVESFSTDSLNLRLVKPKEYLNKNLQFYYTVSQSELNVDFYSDGRDTSGGHFLLFVKPRVEVPADNVYAKRVLFLLSNSGGMFGSRLEQSVDAIGKCLDELQPFDYFNIILFNYNSLPWKSLPVPANSVNIQNAKNYLKTIGLSSGSNMESGLKECFNEIPDDSLSNSIMIFTDGKSLVDPKNIESLNKHNAGIFPIGIGDNLDRARLEMIAELNYGFVTYIEDTDNLYSKIITAFNKISMPVLKDVYLEYGRADLHDLVPAKIPSTYAGSQFFVAGRYTNPGQSAFSVAGSSVSGMRAYDFKLDFSDTSGADRFTESIWAKEMIDAIERQIEIYGQTEELKQRDIDISLKYNIRCMYTAYVADYTTVLTTVDENEAVKNAMIPSSYIAGNYPNPFNPTTTIRFYLDPGLNGNVKFIKIYNIMGQLVAVIDITGYSAGWHEVVFNGKDMFGANLSSGIYFVRLESDGRAFNTVRINLIK